MSAKKNTPKQKMYCNPNGHDIGAIVCDFGSHSSRVGFAGDDMPRGAFSSAVGTITNRESGARTLHHDIYKFRENMAIEHSIKNGTIVDWELFESVVEQSYTEYLRVDRKEAPVLFAEKSFTQSRQRYTTCEIMFEKNEVPALFMSKDAVLQCYACGKTSGLAVDLGSSGAVISPVVDGWVELKGVVRSPVGGRALDAHLLTILKKKQMAAGVDHDVTQPLFRLSRTVVQDRVTHVGRSDVKNVHPSYDAFMRLELARDVKESVCKMADSSLVETDPRYSNIPMAPYELPDGTTVDFGVERFLIPELFFDPAPLDLRHSDLLAALGQPSMPPPPAPPQVQHSPSQSLSPPPAPTDHVSEQQLKGLPRLIAESALRCDGEVQSSLLASMVISGGDSSYDGLPERMRAEVEKLVHASAPAWKVKAVSPGVQERATCAWLGGSILASLGSFHEMWMTRKEYEEFGSALVDKKCP